MLMKIKLAFILSVISSPCCWCNNGMVGEVYYSQRFSCLSEYKEAYSVQSEMQCVHRCLKKENCETINFLGNIESNQLNCEVFSNKRSCFLEKDVADSKAIKFKRFPLIDEIETSSSIETTAKRTVISNLFSSMALPLKNYATSVQKSTTTTSDLIPSQSSTPKQTASLASSQISLQKQTTSLTSSQTSSQPPSTSLIPSQSSTPKATASLASSQISLQKQTTRLFSSETSPQPPSTSLIPSQSSTPKATASLASSQISLQKQTTHLFSSETSPQRPTTSLPSSEISSQQQTTSLPFSATSMVVRDSTTSVCGSSNVLHPTQSSQSHVSVLATIVEKVYESCKEIYGSGRTNLTNRAYTLQSGEHYCVMKALGGCGEGGWTLAMTIDGSKQTFKSSSSFWTDDTVYNVENGVKNPRTEEGKFSAFSSINFNSICVGMNYSGVTKWLLISKSGSSLMDMFKNGGYQQTSIGRAVWKSMMTGSSLQHYCNREGINAMSTSGTIFARIGIIANNDNDCDTPNSYIGLGTKLSHANTCIQQLQGVSCGNLALCDPDNGVKSLSARGYILIK